MTRHAPVHVITDLPERPIPLLRQVLDSTFLLGIVAVPILAFTAIPVGMLLGWPPFVVFCAAVVGAPVLINLVDLLGACLGWPSLRWVAGQVLGRRSTTTKEGGRRG